MAVSPNEEKPFIFTEDISSGLVVRLEGSATPFGRPRDAAAFETGGPLQHEKIYLPGRRSPIYQVQQPRERDLEIHGHFRDHLRAEDIGAQDLGWARSMERDIEEIRRRANLLTIEWAQKRWTGLLIETDFKWESEHDALYSLKFAVASTTDSVEASDGSLQPVQPPIDIVALVQRDLAEARAQMAALAAQANALKIQATILNALDAAQQAARDMAVAVATLSTSTGAAERGAARRVDGTGKATQDQCAAVLTLVTGIKTEDVVTLGDPGGILAWHSAQAQTLTALYDSTDRARTLRASARSRIRKTVRLYSVKPGDTLESIARAQLGDASRAGDLGVRAEELHPGLVIRLPEAA